MKAPTGNEGAGDVASGLGDVSSAVWDVSSGSGRSVELLELRQLLLELRALAARAVQKLPLVDLGLRVVELALAAHGPRAWTAGGCQKLEVSLLLQ